MIRKPQEPLLSRGGVKLLPRSSGLSSEAPFLFNHWGRRMWQLKILHMSRKLFSSLKCPFESTKGAA